MYTSLYNWNHLVKQIMNKWARMLAPLLIQSTARLHLRLKAHEQDLPKEVLSLIYPREALVESFR